MAKQMAKQRETPLQRNLKAQISELEQELRAIGQTGGTRSIRRRQINERLSAKRTLLSEAQAASARGAAMRAERERKARVERARRSLGR